MISFRFHIVSLTAVFLALAIGIGIGATVVDQATVDTIEGQLDAAERRANATNEENDALQADLDQWRRFADDGALELVRGRLDIPVVIVSVTGVDPEPVEALRQLLLRAGAQVQGTVRFAAKLDLGTQEDVQSLQSLLGVTATRPDVLRRNTASRLASSLVTGPTLLPALLDEGFLEYEAVEGQPVDASAIGAPGTLFVVVSDGRPKFPNDQIAIPFVSTLAAAAPKRVLAAEPGRPATEEDPAVRAAFLRPLRSEPAVAEQVSTVDNLEDVRGRIAVVFALEALAEGRNGHFGVDAGTRALPEPSP